MDGEKEVSSCFVCSEENPIEDMFRFFGNEYCSTDCVGEYEDYMAEIYNQDDPGSEEPEYFTWA